MQISEKAPKWLRSYVYVKLVSRLRICSPWHIMYIHSLFFTAFCPPKPMKPPPGWLIKMVAIVKYELKISEGEVCLNDGDYIQ